MRLHVHSNAATLTPADARAEIVSAALRKEPLAKVRFLVQSSPAAINDDLRKHLTLLGYTEALS